MATEQETEIPLVFSRQQQGFRLLELPPALVGLLRSASPPVLSIKSASSSASSGTLNGQSAVVCTSKDTFELRQVHSSNSLLLLQPSRLSLGLHEEPTASSGVSIVGSSKATLELHPISSTEKPQLYWTLALLPVYKGPTGDGEYVDMTIDPPAHQTDKYTKLRLFEDTPVSDEDCINAWNELFAFEHDGQAWRPQYNTLLGLWKAFATIVDIERLDIHSSFERKATRRLVVEDGWPEPLLDTFLTQLSVPEEQYQAEWAYLDSTVCVSRVGLWLLGSGPRGPSDPSVSAFLEIWKDLLPEAWRNDVSLESLQKDSYYQPTSTTIRIAKEEGPTGTKLDSGPQTSKQAAAKRKWHEKFRNSK